MAEEEFLAVVQAKFRIQIPKRIRLFLKLKQGTDLRVRIEKVKRV